MERPAALPLEGVRVLELAHLIAGPICGMYLADMGADVVKIESREALDAGRTVYRASRGGEGVLHLTVNRNKRAVCVDLRRPEGHAVFRRLAGRTDVIIEGFRGGGAERRACAVRRARGGHAGGGCSRMIVEQDHPRAGRFKTIAMPVRLQKTPGTIRTPAPGEHTREVLREIGYAGGDIEALGASGVI